MPAMYNGNDRLHSNIHNINNSTNKQPSSIHQTNHPHPHPHPQMSASAPKFNPLSQQQLPPPSRIGSRNYGNNIILTRNSEGQPSLTLGPHWYIFLFAFIITLALFVMLLYTLHAKLDRRLFALLCVVGVVYAYAYGRVGLSNPGFALPTWEFGPGDQRVCQVCGVKRSHNIYHCSDCNVCIEGFDHHCPWVGKCIGAKNLNSFYFFLIMIFGSLVLCFVATITTANTKPIQAAASNGTNLIIMG